MTQPDHFLDRLRAADVMNRYAACIDDRDLEMYRRCFVPDVELHGFAPEPIRGVDAWIAFVENVLERFSATQHMLGPPLVTLDGDAATMRTELQAQHFFKEPEGRIFSLWGTYRTALVRNDGGWAMARHELVTRATRTDDVFRT